MSETAETDKLPANCTSVLEPLSLPDRTQSVNDPQVSESRGLIPCMLCEESFSCDPEGKSNSFLQHLLTLHKMVIAKVEQVSDLASYCFHWKKRFKEHPKLEEFCAVINTNTAPTDPGPTEQYYLLSDVLPEDHRLREYLQRKRLEEILACQQRERTDSTFSRGCLFCRQNFEGNRSLLFTHMATDHGFNVGLPDNLVHVNLFLDILEEKLRNLQCLYCEKTFGDRQMLKDHMRKKRHKRLNPRNRSYDKFYIINYLELGKTWEEIQGEEDQDEAKQAEEEWSDWKEEQPPVVCLFCDHSDQSSTQLITHMKEEHNFQLPNTRVYPEMNFYQQVKVVNYIRRQVHHNICIHCQSKHNNKESMRKHMKQDEHFKLPQDNSIWDQPQYFFPTYENDVLLCFLEDDDDAGKSDEEDNN